MAKKYWLMKSEPEVFSIDDLKKHKKTLWEGVRNYQARNFMMKDMQVGDEVLFYHSNAEPTGVFGTAVVSKTAVPDPTQFEKKSEYFDAKALKEKPTWFCVEVSFSQKFKTPVTLETMKKTAKLKDMLVIKRGMRLSVQPVSAADFKTVCELGE